MWPATTDHGLHVTDKANMGFWPDEIKMYQHNFQNILEQTFFIGTLNAWLNPKNDGVNPILYITI
jgi:hypothetical protein